MRFEKHKGFPIEDVYKISDSGWVYCLNSDLIGHVHPADHARNAIEGVYLFENKECFFTQSNWESCRLCSSPFTSEILIAGTKIRTLLKLNNEISEPISPYYYYKERS